MENYSLIVALVVGVIAIKLVALHLYLKKKITQLEDKFKEDDK